MDFKVGPLPEIIFGCGKRFLLLDILKNNRRSTVVITSPGMVKRDHYNQLMDKLQRENLVSQVYSSATPEPSLEDVDACLESLKGLGVDIIVGIGGGSVLDLTKAVGARLGIPKIVLPTTAGTGCEVTSRVVLKEKGRKKSFKDGNFIPSIAIVDPEFTLTVPAQLAVTTGLDAFAHATECLGSKNSNFLTNIVASTAAGRIEDAFEDAMEGNLGARTSMALGSLLAGIAFGSAGTTLGHGLSYPLANRGLSHSMAVSLVLPYALELNGHSDLVDFVKRVSKNLVIPEIPSWDILVMVEEVMGDRRHLGNNPKEVTREDVLEIYKKLEEVL